MALDPTDLALLAAIQDGLPLVPRPYAAVGETIGLSEGDVIARLGALIEAGIVKRLGVIVRHHELGYRANAMAVWNVPDERVDEAGRRAAALDFVTLCYRRPRRPPAWPYNLFCMIHGRDREAVRDQVARVAESAGLAGLPAAVLFSTRRFKQRGARFLPASAEAA